MHWKTIVTTAVLALLPGALVSCTIYASTSLSGLGDGNGKDSGVDAYNGCRNILTTVSKCGECLEGNAGDYANALCAHNSNATILSDMEDCAKDPSVTNYNCGTFFPQSDAALSSADSEPALTSNIKVTAGKGCESSCQYAFLTYSGCSGQTKQIAEAGACGACITEKCRAELAACVKKSDLDKDPITACAANSNDCVTPTCTELINAKADGGYSACSLTAYTCVKAQCATECSL
jgi:hypothetical protein